MRFCGECGSALGEAAPALAPAAEAPAKATTPTAERRRVSVLFADLVGFTSLSETRDSEEVRELLSQYFDRCRRLIGIYGGTVEKFIGDAVMAVWGTPVAQEDDAERAVRAALDLVVAVTELGNEVGAPDLRLRVGVLTGETAVTLGAKAEGMVAGDIVNTAARIQSSAEPGTVLVGEATMRATDSAVAYEAAGEFELKGKAEPVALYRALRVTSVRGGALRASELEAPFVGRQHELNLVKELFHASAEGRRAHLVSAVGIGGIGKSRLAWEFEKYIDGVLEQVWWHHGRCLAYGDGVAYWALAEMVRMRALISDEDDVGEALAKLRRMVEESIFDAQERTFVEQRLASLLGLAEQADERQSLFAAWRLLFERLADQGPVVLVFEDLQWADTSLLDFIEHLLEWSREHPIFVLALTRPELAERRPGFGSGRAATSLSLDRLPEQAMGELLDGLAPGLPRDLHTRVLQRAEGVPLYAVETVRMLLNRGLLERADGAYRPTGPIGALEVPETLHALVAARLDGLTSDERFLVQDAAVLGRSFTKAGLAALSSHNEATIDGLIASLVRKEVVAVQADPRSPERGQYAFLQDLVKRIAYDTLARADRKARHVAAAEHLENLSGSEQELVEVIASHYLDAYQAAPDAGDATALRTRARERLSQAGDRAAALGANEEAIRYFTRAAELADSDEVRAALLEQAGVAATHGGNHSAAIELLEQVLTLQQQLGGTHAARTTAKLGYAIWRGGDLEGGAVRLEQALAVLADDEPDAEIAELLEAHGRLCFFRGDFEIATVRIDRALEIAEGLMLSAVLVDALTTKGLIMLSRSRYWEARALLSVALELGREHDLAHPLIRAVNNYGAWLAIRGDFTASRGLAREGVELSRRFGFREAEAVLLEMVVSNSWWLGDFDMVADAATQVTGDTPYAMGTRASAEIRLAVPRGDTARARQALEAWGDHRSDPDLQLRALYQLAESQFLCAGARHAEAAENARAARETMAQLGERLNPDSWLAELEALAGAAATDELEEALALRDLLPASERIPLVEALHARFLGLLLHQRGDSEQGFEEQARAEQLFGALELTYLLAITQLEHAEHGDARNAEPLLREARETFDRLGARPALERADAIEYAVPLAATAD